MCSLEFGMDHSYIGVHFVPSSSCLEGTKTLEAAGGLGFFASLKERGGGTQLRGQALSCELL